MLPQPYLPETRPLLPPVWFLLHPKQVDVNNQTHKVIGTKILHTIQNYLFVQHLLHRTSPLVHINPRLQYGITKLTSPYYMNYSYVSCPTTAKATSVILLRSKTTFCFHLCMQKLIARYLFLSNTSSV